MDITNEPVLRGTRPRAAQPDTRAAEALLRFAREARTDVGFGFLDEVGPLTLPRRLLWAARTTLRAYPRDLLHSPARLTRRAMEQFRAVRVLWPAENLSRRQEEKFLSALGTSSSLRQYVDTRRMLTFNQEVDVKDGFYRLLQITYQEISTFLEARNISTRELQRHENSTVTQILGNIHAYNVSIGDAGRAGDTVNTGSSESAGP